MAGIPFLPLSLPGFYSSEYIAFLVANNAIFRDLEGKHIAIDGKRLKGSKKKTGSTHILSHLYEDFQDCFTGQYKTHNYETLEKNHGRIEKRTYTTLSASEVFDEGEYSQWQGLRSLVQVKREISSLEGETRIDKQYYISSLPPEDCPLIGQYIRGHWGIENRPHWHLDVTFREDACRARKDYSATNLNTLRKFALAIVSQYKDKVSLRKRLFKAALNMDYLKKLLKI